MDLIAGGVGDFFCMYMRGFQIKTFIDAYFYIPNGDSTDSTN